MSCAGAADCVFHAFRALNPADFEQPFRGISSTQSRLNRTGQSERSDAESVECESSEMVRRYAHLAPAHLAKHAEVVAGLLSDTNAAQREKEKGLAEANPLNTVGGA